MTDSAPTDTSEKPLDPAVLRIHKRATRLMLIAGLTLGLGLLTVFGAIIYRLSTYADKSQAAEAAPAAPSVTAAPAAEEVPASAAPSTPPAPAVSAPTDSAAVAKAIEKARAVLPARAWLVSVAIDGERIVLAYEHVNGTTMFVVDAATLEIEGRLDLKPE